MKKFLIALLAIAVIFGFAACDNSSSTPDTGDATETPINIDYAKYAAEETVGLFYDTNPSINIATLITTANEYERSFDGKNVVIEKTTTTGPYVGTIKVTLSGDYTAPKAPATDGTLSVNDYTIEATDLKVYGDGSSTSTSSTYRTYSFNITGAIAGISDLTIADEKTVPAISGSVVAYAPLSGQTASITMAVPVSEDADGNVTYETRTYSDAEYKNNLAALAGTNNPAEYMKTVIKTYLADVNAKDVDLVTLVAKFVNGTVTEEEKKTADASVTYTVTTEATEENKWKEDGVVTISFKGTGYEMNDSKIDGAFTLSFPKATRSGSNAAPDEKVAVTLGAEFEITGTGLKLSGQDYPVTFSVEKAIVGGTVNGGTVTLDEDGKVTAITAPTAFGSYTSGLIDVNGVDFLIADLNK